MNSFRDEMKDQIRNYLLKWTVEDIDVINEAACDLADIAFDVAGTESLEQDLVYWKYD